LQYIRFTQHSFYMTVIVLDDFVGSNLAVVYLKRLSVGRAIQQYLSLSLSLSLCSEEFTE
jgi:hypothetical protein